MTTFVSMSASVSSLLFTTLPPMFLSYHCHSQVTFFCIFSNYVSAIIRLCLDVTQGFLLQKYAQLLSGVQGPVIQPITCWSSPWNILNKSMHKSYCKPMQICPQIFCFYRDSRIQGLSLLVQQWSYCMAKGTIILSLPQSRTPYIPQS